MTKLEWDKAGARKYETGVSHGVLYVPNENGIYDFGVEWNGLVSITDTPSGAESNKQYADNIIYANIKSAEEVGGTIEAFTYPDEFEAANGVAELAPGVKIGQQRRATFGLSWQSLIGNDLLGTDYGYKIHIVYGADANPSEQTHSTVNDSPEASTLSWEYTTSPVAVPGFKPASKLVFESTNVDPAKLAELEDILYGSEGSDPRLPMPAEIIALFGSGITNVVATAPTATSAGVITIPSVTGVRYRRDDTNAVVTNAATVQVPGGIGSSLKITAEPSGPTYQLKNSDDDWVFTKTA